MSIYANTCANERLIVKIREKYIITHCLTDFKMQIYLTTFGYALFQVTYLGAFSCEVSWILEAHGDLPIYAYLLCSGYFIMFIASTILIHGLATVSYPKHQAFAE